jgi:3-oxoacyl-[acyl-carrier protein] reductase
MSSEASERGQTAIVTGAAGAIGQACCAALVSAGMDVVATDVDGDGAARSAAEAAVDGGRARGVALDVTDPAAVGALARELGRVDVLVNLAGVIRNATLSKIIDGDFKWTIDTHLGGTLNTMRAFAPTMREAGYGRIVNTSSIAARGVLAGGSYGAAKGAVEALTRTAALELAAHGITVNCIAPGLVNAGMFMSTPEHFREELTQRIPVGRLADASEIAACVAFLSSAGASYVTGQTLTICGGLSVGF